MFKLSLSKDCKQISIITLICLIVWGCGSTPTTKKSLLSNQVSVGHATNSYNYYLNLSQRSSGINSQANLLLALRAALKNNKIKIADNLFTQLPATEMLTDDHRLELQLLQSIRLAFDNDFKQAISVLTPNSQWKLSSQRWIAYYDQRAKLLIKNQEPMLAIETLILAEQTATNAEQLINIQDLIWKTYQSLSLELLENIDTYNYSYQQRGWHQLVLLSKTSLNSPEVLTEKLKQWKIDFSSHLAINNLPKQLLMTVNITPFNPQKIAVILPLTGRYARLGEAVQNGLLSHLLTTNSEQEIITLDSNELGGVGAYQQAIELNSEFIIGPLLKSNVAEVSIIETLIPTLFLNTPSDVARLPNQFYFSLDKENEATQGAHYIFQQGRKRPVIVAPDNVKGHQMAKLFQEQWLELHDSDKLAHDIEPIFFANDNELKKSIEQLFETNKSQARINLTRLLVGSKMKSETRSRRDIDAIYLVANPKQTAMLMPSVEVTVSAFANQVPVFVGSSGNAHRFNDSGLTHLNQLNVSEIPWFLTSSNLSPTVIKKLWPNMSQSQLRFFAMGYDALAIIPQLAHMEYFPEYRRTGLTGDLSLDENGQVQRQLSWAQFQRGRLKKIQ